MKSLLISVAFYEVFKVIFNFDKDQCKFKELGKSSENNGFFSRVHKM